MKEYNVNIKTDSLRELIVKLKEAGIKFNIPVPKPEA